MAGNPRIVIVDQDFETRAELQKGLAKSRFIVVGGVGYGAEALSLASEIKPQAVLICVEEPTARALQTIEQLTGILPEAAIIAYSSLADSDSARRAVIAGARDYLTKPLKTDDVIKAVEMGLAQQERRRALLTGEQPAPVRTGGMIVTVFGAKGGIGKTTISINLATAFQTLGVGSSVIVDSDTIFGDVAMMMDLPVETSLIDATRDIEDLDRDSISKYLIHHPCGVAVLPAPFEPTDWRNVPPESMEKVLSLLAQTHDFVIVDTPGTFTDLVGVALEKATVILLVTSLDITSIKDTTVALKLLSNGSYSEEKIKLTVNHATNVNSVKDTDVGKVLRQEVFWSIPHDEEIGQSAQIGSPAVIDRPDSRAAQSIQELAAVLSGYEPVPVEHVAARVEDNGGGLLKKFIFRQ
ncbi:MAG: response regulator [Chloroflexi bacterium]|nr:response regulator [Chloroflexota bacterium]